MEGRDLIYSNGRDEVDSAWCTLQSVKLGSDHLYFAKLTSKIMNQIARPFDNTLISTLSGVRQHMIMAKTCSTNLNSTLV